MRDDNPTNRAIKLSDNLTVKYIKHRYPEYPQYFAAERLRILTEPNVSIAVIRDIDQIMSREDIKNIKNFIDSKFQQLVYRWIPPPPSKKYCHTIGGGFAIKLSEALSLTELESCINANLNLKKESKGRGTDEFTLDKLYSLTDEKQVRVLNVDIRNCCCTWETLCGTALLYDKYCVDCYQDEQNTSPKPYP